MPRPLPNGFAVAWDSRGGPPDGSVLDDVLGPHNGDLPLGPVHDGQTRAIFVGLGDAGNPNPAVEVNVTVVGQSDSGFVAIGPRLDAINGSLVNWTPTKPVDSNTCIVAIPSGHVYIQAENACHVIVAVTARS